MENLSKLSRFIVRKCHFCGDGALCWYMDENSHYFCRDCGDYLNSTQVEKDHGLLLNKEQETREDEEIFSLEITCTKCNKTLCKSKFVYEIDDSFLCSICFNQKAKKYKIMVGE